MLYMCLLGSFLRFVHLSWFLKVGFFLGASDCWIGDPSGTVEVACLCATWPRLRFLFYFRFLRDFAILDVAPEVCKYGLKQPLKKHSCVLFPVRVFLTKGTSILT